MRKIVVVVCLLSMAFAACGKDDSPAIDDAPKATSLKVEAKEGGDGTYGFNAPDTIDVPALAAIEFNNPGKEEHQAAMIKLAEGTTLDQALGVLLGTEAPTGPPPFSVGGGTTVIPAGKSITVTEPLPEGTYGFICFVPDAKGVPHVVNGMKKTITVTGTSAINLPVPDGENSTVSEYTYELPALKAGTTTIRVHNTGEQAHEYDIASVADGKTADDALAWLKNPQGPPPISEVGGPVVQNNGGGATFDLTVEKGTYVVYCRIPDANDGQEHLAHGMFKGFTVT